MQNPYGGRANPGYTTTFDLNGSRVTPAAANGGHGLSSSGFRRAPHPKPEHRGEAGEFHEAAHTFAMCTAYSSQLLPAPAAPVGPAIPIGAAPLIATLVLPVGRHLRQESSKDYSAAFR